MGSFEDLGECTKCHGEWPPSDAEMKGGVTRLKNEIQRGAGCGW